MKLGIFGKVFPRNNVDAVFEAVASHGLQSMQFNMICAGLESMPEEIPKEVVRQVRAGLSEHGLTMCGLSATFNSIHPDIGQREKGIRRFKVLAARAKELGTDLLSLCSGTRSRVSMWENHPDNSSSDAYQDLLEIMGRLLEVAEECDLRLGLEPEIHNVIDSPAKARRLLDDLNSSRLGIIMDPANLFRFEDLPRMDEILREALGVLGSHIWQAHAKDLSNDNPPAYGPAGSGCLNYELYLRLLDDVGYDGPLVLHSLAEAQVPDSVAYLKSLQG